ncbi:MAG TPA: hypothetical protein VL860_05250 [Planctomycetota bacterium]|nr:hypothetical protein [Planctomycetota bacterium]
MRSLVWLIAVSLLLTAGCDEPEPEHRTDTPVAEKPADAPKPEAVSNDPVANQWAIAMPEFIQYISPIYVTRGRPIFDSLVEFESACVNVEPYLKPVSPRLRIDWKYLADNTRQMEVSLLDAMNDHINTALNQAPKGGGEMAFGDEFQLDLINLHEVARKLYWAANAQDLAAARRFYTSLRVLLGPRPAVQNGERRSARPELAVESVPDDGVIKGKSDRYGNLENLKARTNIRTSYAFWPAPVGTKVEYLSADAKPPKIDWSVDMSNTPDFDKAQWPQPVIINTRDLRQENEYSKRINQVEVR